MPRSSFNLQKNLSPKRNRLPLREKWPLIVVAEKKQEFTSEDMKIDKLGVSPQHTNEIIQKNIPTQSESEVKSPCVA